ncbi:hypothetical protein, partial [Mycobacterium sp. 852002-40037_SCH5390672]|uniref:hypothetical protein n=1 Tax=Mycobacterium sp. 852002-40037_SCH5390672 TaxID=1834089 RepID=UPI001E415125
MCEKDDNGDECARERVTQTQPAKNEPDAGSKGPTVMEAQGTIHRPRNEHCANGSHRYTQRLDKLVKAPDFGSSHRLNRRQPRSQHDTSIVYTS